MTDEAREERGPKCPKCQDRLVEKTIRKTGVRVDTCPACHGMWFECGELQATLLTVEGDIVPSADARATPRQCPACGIAMTAFSYSGTDVTVDLCEQCHGVWLDVGELRMLEKRPVPAAGGGILGFLARLLG